jgi:hypothetical protein
MSKFNAKEVGEINAIIADIEKVVKAKSEIGARDRATVTSLLTAAKVAKKPVFFKCRKEYSDAIVGHFVKEKNITRNKYHMSSQGYIYVIN